MQTAPLQNPTSSEACTKVKRLRWAQLLDYNRICSPFYEFNEPRLTPEAQMPIPTFLLYRMWSE